MSTTDLPAVYISIESDDIEFFGQLSKTFPDVDISKSRNLLGIGEIISILLAGISAVVAILQYVSEKKAVVREIKIKQGPNSKIFVIQVKDKTLEELTSEILRISQDE
jgi:hypothetical protein